MMAGRIDRPSPHRSVSLFFHHHGNALRVFLNGTIFAAFG
jgi:hypothetical protein